MTRACRRRRTKTEGWPDQFVNFLRKLFDFDVLILVDIREMLPGISRRPPHVDRDNARIVPQADVLFQRL
jgi:hypothetical protein